ncbi:MAG: putative porin [Paraglaciecola sp.]
MQYATRESDNSVAADATQVAIGYDSKFNENTIGYVAYAHMRNDVNVNLSVNGKGLGYKVVRN